MTKYKVFHKDYLGDDYKTIEAFDSEQAAETYAEYFDAEGDYSCVGGSTLVVEVQGPDLITEKFFVTGESTPVYLARKCKE